MIRLTIALAFAMSAPGCGSSVSDMQITADEACTDLAHARCTHLASCSATAIALRFGDETTCEAQEKSNCISSLAAPSTGNSPTHNESCSAAIATWACPDYLNNTATPPACQQQTGSLIAGAACAFAGQCQSGFCAIVPGSACGMCAPAPVAGDSCAELT